MKADKQVLSRIAETISRHRMFEPGQKVGVAVSGGADSVCLLHALLDLAPRWNLRLSVLHLNHCLRGRESEADASFVRELAGRFGLPVSVREVDVAAIPDNLEQAGRSARREFFLEKIRSGDVDVVALGHTRSDQAETVLFRFLRGAGTAGLAGIRPVTAEGLVRPLIEVTRSEIESFLRGRGICWREDASNADPAFARNRIRRELLPALTRDWNPALPETLARMAEVARDEEEYWAAEVERIDLAESPVGSTAKAGHVLVNVPRLVALPRAVARRVVRRAMEQVRGDLRSIDFAHVEQVRDLAAAADGSGRFQAPGLDVFRSFDWIRLAVPGTDRAEDRNYAFPVGVPCKICIPGRDCCISLKVKNRSRETGIEVSPGSGYNNGGSDLDWDRISGDLEVRNWRPGDQYQPIGHARETKIKVLFQQFRIPLWERRKWPIVACGESIVWAARFGAAAGAAATPETRMVLEIRESGDFH
jgi:tRNA(Ile)-lysidine synthase